VLLPGGDGGLDRAPDAHDDCKGVGVRRPRQCALLCSILLLAVLQYGIWGNPFVLSMATNSG
jgi:hypothetical protein